MALGIAMFGMCNVWDVNNIRNVRCLTCGMFGMLNIWDVGYWDVGCWGCGIFGIWDVEMENVEM